MHCLAGLDRPTSGRVVLGGNVLSELNDRALTTVRRDNVGFVFQAFNLLPTLTALQNIVLPLDLAGRRPDPQRSTRSSRPLASVTGSATSRPSCRGASSSGWRSPAH